MRFGMMLKAAGFAAAVLLVALVAVVKSIQVDRYRGVLAEMAKAVTGRTLTINGKLALRLSLSPALVADDVVLANAPSGTQPEMIRVGRIEARIGLLPLLMHEVRITRLRLADVDIRLERNVRGRGNWEFTGGGPLPPADAAGTPTSVRLGHVRFENVRISYSNVAEARADSIRIDRLTADADNAASPLAVFASGDADGRHFDVSGVLGPLAGMMAVDRPFPVKLKAVLPSLVVAADGAVTNDRHAGPQLDLRITGEAGEVAEAGTLAGLTIPPLGPMRLAARLAGPLAAPALEEIDAAVGRRDAVALTAKGTVKAPLAGQGVDLLLAADGENLAGFNRQLDVALPAVGPVKASTRLTDGDGGWRLTDFRMGLGASDLAGTVLFALKQGRPKVTARLTSATFDVGQWIRQGQQTDAAADGRLFSDQPLPVAGLRRTDADIRWKIDHLIDGSLAVGQVDVTASLKDGRLQVVPNAGSVAGGTAAGRLTVDAGDKPASISLTLDARKVLMGDVLKGLNVTTAVHAVPADIRLDLAGQGDSWRAVMAKLHGSTMLVADGGTIDGAPLQMALDPLKRLAAAAPGKATDLKCLVSHFSVADGVARSEALVLDTGGMTVGGQGSVNLASESIDLNLAPTPRQAGPLNLTVPVDIGGTLVHPSLLANRGPLIRSVSGSPAASPQPLPSDLLAEVAAGSESNPCLAALSPPKATPPRKAPVHKVGGGKPAVRHHRARAVGDR